MWEDVRNKSGGRWLFSLDKRERKDILDSCWLETVSIVCEPLQSERPGTFWII